VNLHELTDRINCGTGCTCCGAKPDDVRAAAYEIEETAKRHAERLREIVRYAPATDARGLAEIADWLDPPEASPGEWSGVSDIWQGKK
jgi:hypothetical protein